jgi:biopolymer transport protein ExbD
MRAWPVLLVLFACTKDERPSERPPEDCDLVRKDPGTAAAKLSQKYRNAPVRVAEIIERCVAPAGAPCERLAKVVAALPGLMPAGGSGSLPDAPANVPANVIELCNGMPPEMQRCMFPSYALGHADECAKIREQMTASALELRPDRAGSPAGGATEPPPCAELHLDVTASEITVRRETTQTLARAAGKLDQDALRAMLGGLATTCRGGATLTGADDVPYRDLISVMDVAVAAGFPDVGVDVPEAALPAPADRADRAPLPSATESLPSAPVIAVTREAVLLAGQELARLPADVTGPVAAALAKVRPADAKQPGLAILQADERTPMRTIKQIIVGGRKAGFDNLLFAVKRR